MLYKMRSVAKLDHLSEQDFGISCLQHLDVQDHSESREAVDEQLFITGSSASALLKSKHDNAGCLDNTGDLLKMIFSMLTATTNALVIEGRQQSLE